MRTMIEEYHIHTALNLPCAAGQTVEFDTLTGSTYTMSRGRVSGGINRAPRDYTHCESTPFVHNDELGFKLVFTNNGRWVLTTSPIVKIRITLQ